MDKYTAKIKFWGTRGSIPTPGKYVVRYGGNTSCVELRCGDTVIVFDAGSGLRELGGAMLQEFLGRELECNILISHTHWDHIQGFPFFSVAYLPTTTINFYGGNSVSNLERLIFDQMDPEYFPVTLFELASTINFKKPEESPFMIGDDICVHYTHLIHPSLSLGYRIEYKGKVIVYMTDCEISHDPELEKLNEKNIALLIRNADILIADCQYTADEYEKKAGWGHSSIDKMIEVAGHHGVKNLFAFHHDPLHTDEEIDIMIEHGRKIAKPGLQVYGAKEKSTVYLV